MYFVQRFPSTWGQFVRPVAAHLQPLLTLLGLLLDPREVIELRVSEWPHPHRPPRLSANGYFYDPMELAEAIRRYEHQPVILEFAVNPVRHNLLLAASNTLRRPAAWTSQASDVTRRAALPIKFHLDPAVFPETEQEGYALILRRAQQCRQFLTQRYGWPAPAIVDSSYAIELLYRVDLPNTSTSTALVEQLLATLSQRFSDDTVLIDAQAAQAVYTYPVFGVNTHPPAVKAAIAPNVLYLPDTLLAVNPELLQVTAGGELPMRFHALVDGNAIDAFVGDLCVLEAEAWTPTGVLYRAYQAFCQARGLHALPIAHFARRLVADYDIQPGSRKVRGLVIRGLWGIRLR